MSGRPRRGKKETVVDVVARRAGLDETDPKPHGLRSRQSRPSRTGPTARTLAGARPVRPESDGTGRPLTWAGGEQLQVSVKGAERIEGRTPRVPACARTNLVAAS